MKRFQNILVVVDATQEGFGRDGSMPSESASAINHARWVQQHSGGRLTVLTVVPHEEEHDNVRFARSMLDACCAPLLEEADAPLLAVAGEPYVEIIRAVEREGYDLVVAGARPHGLLHRTVVGSTSTKLLRKCPCPVWVAPRVFDHSPKAVLSAVGFHGLTPYILELSSSLVKLTGGSWHVMHVMEYFEEGGMRIRDATEEQILAYRKRARERDFDRMHEYVDPLVESTGVTPRLWLADGSPEEQIHLAVRKLGIDVLVMGTVGRTGLPGLIIGNTADKILSTVECSVLAVKPDEFVSPVRL